MSESQTHSKTNRQTWVLPYSTEGTPTHSLTSIPRPIWGWVNIISHPVTARVSSGEAWGSNTGMTLGEALLSPPLMNPVCTSDEMYLDSVVGNNYNSSLM